MLTDVPKLDLRQLNVEKGYSNLIITLTIGATSTAPYPTPTPAQTSTDRVRVSIVSNTKSPVAMPETNDRQEKAYEFILSEGVTPQMILDKLTEAFGCAAFLNL
jgi:hypothetical protein